MRGIDPAKVVEINKYDRRARRSLLTGRRNQSVSRQESCEWIEQLRRWRRLSVAVVRRLSYETHHGSSYKRRHTTNQPSGHHVFMRA